MERSGFGITLLAVGLVILVVFATADLIGLGADPRFGPKQIVGSLVGLAVIAWGGYVYFGKAR